MTTDGREDAAGGSGPSRAAGRSRWHGCHGRGLVRQVPARRGSSSFPEWETAAGLDSWEEAPAPAQVGKRVVEGLLQRQLKPETARLMTNLVHWGYGIAWGAAYGIVAASTKRPRTIYGLLFGPIVVDGLPGAAGDRDLQADARLQRPPGLRVGTAATFKALAGRG